MGAGAGFTSSGSFTFDNVSLPAGSDVSILSGTSTSLRVINGLVLDGRLLVGNETATGFLDLSGTQTITGIGTILFGAVSGNIINNSTAATTVTLSSGIGIRGKSGALRGTLANVYVVNGLIQPDGAGANISLLSTAAVVNRGSIISGTGTSVSISSSTFTNNGLLRVANGGRIDVTGGFANFTEVTNIGAGAFTATLSGGSYEVDELSTLRFVPNTTTTQQFFITKLSANLTLSGANAKIYGMPVNYNYDALRFLQTIDTNGTLSLTNGRVFEPRGTLINRGTLLVDATSRLGVTTADPLVASGLTSSYSAENNANDSTGANPGTLIGGTTFGTGISGSAFLLDGVDDYVSINDSATTRPSPATYELWFRLTAQPTTFATLVSKPSAANTNNSFALSYFNGSLNYNVGSTASVFFLPDAGFWHHVALTFDAGVVKLYLDGTQVGSVTGMSLTYGNFPILIGASQQTTAVRTSFFPGLIDEFRIYNRALTASELKNQYLNNLPSRVELASGLANISGELTSQNEATLSGGTLQGTGAIPTRLNQTGGQLAPGNSPGCMTVNGNYNLAAAGSIQIEVNGPTACTEHDRLSVNGNVALAGSLNLVLPPAYTPAIGTQFIIVDNDGSDAISGQFSGLPERQVFVANATELFQISYRGGTGNDVTLTYLGSGVVVTSTADVGPGSLVEAINATNLRPGNQIIAFSIPAAQATNGTYTLNFGSSNLPLITDSTVLDASTQREFVDRPVIELLSQSHAKGLVLDPSAVSSVVRGLSLTGWSNGIQVMADSATIAGNFIGLKPDGSEPLNRNLVGVLIGDDASNSQLVKNTRIGGTTTRDRNVISANQTHGIFVKGDGDNRLKIQGNFIGTDPTGQTPRPNQENGIYVLTPEDSTELESSVIGGIEVGAGNIISGNSQSGIRLDATDFYTIAGNYIGTTVDGLAVLANGTGIAIVNNSDATTIGGTQAAARNTISGNAVAGISITGSSSTSVLGNYIGLNRNGDQMLGNQVGISVDGEATTR